METRELLEELREYPGLSRKRAIGDWAGRFTGAGGMDSVPGVYGPGDDAGAVEIEGGYLLLSGEGIWPPLLEDPGFAGFSAVTVNVNDIYAMGGRPLGLLAVVFEGGISGERRERFLDGLERGLAHYRLPLLGGHTSPEGGEPAVAVSIAGFARDLLKGNGASPGDELLVALDLNGRRHPLFFAWDTVTVAPDDDTLGKLEALPELARRGLCSACRDISNPGVLGTAAMMMEASGAGADIVLDRMPVPPGAELSWWLKAYPSFGFLLSADPSECDEVIDVFRSVRVRCESIGTVTDGSRITVRLGEESGVFLDWRKEPVTGLFS